jgi:hypothetical protein
LGVPQEELLHLWSGVRNPTVLIVGRIARALKVEPKHSSRERHHAKSFRESAGEYDRDSAQSIS